MHGLFITGTDTEVGKTVVAAALMHRFRDYGPLCYWKPIQTGIEVDDDDTATVRMLGTCREAEILDAGIRLPRPLSPHLAARLAGKEIDVELLAQTVETRAGTCSWIVEGAGGALVPINDRYLMIEFMERLRLGVLVVARSTLGTINHTLMTLEALRRRTLPVAGVVMVGDPNPANRESIARFGNIAVVAEMPIFQTLTHAEVAAWARVGMDPGGILQEFLQ